MKDLLSPIELAIKFELEGREYFLSAAEKVLHPLGRKMFEALANDENKHILMIKNIKNSIIKENSWPDDMQAVPAGESLTTVFDVAMNKMDKDINPSETDLEVIAQALKLEKEGYRFYLDLAEKTKEPMAKEFYERLAEEEKGHFAILQKTEEYLRSPADWFCDEERPIFEG